MSTEQLVLTTARIWGVSRSNDEVENWRGAYSKPATASVNMIPESEILFYTVSLQTAPSG